MQTIRPIICCGCHATRKGLPLIEKHHPLGDANDPATVPLRRSTHRFFTDRQNDWPPGVLDNLSRSPQVRAVALRCALVDLTAFFADRLGLQHAA
jgi:hypothetical protein